MKKNIMGNTVVFIGRHEKKHKGQHCCFYRSSWKKHKGNNRKTHIHFNVMYILFIDDWLSCIVIASVVQWSALCLTHCRPWLNFCGNHNIFNFKRNAIMSYITTDKLILQISVGSGESCELTPWRPGFKSGWRQLLEDSYLYFMRIIKSSITIVLPLFCVLMVHWSFRRLTL